MTNVALISIPMTIVPWFYIFELGIRACRKLPGFEYGLEFQGSGVANFLKLLMKNSEAMSLHTCKVCYQSFQNTTSEPFFLVSA